MVVLASFSVEVDRILCRKRKLLYRWKEGREPRGLSFERVPVQSSFILVFYIKCFYIYTFFLLVTKHTFIYLIVQVFFSLRHTFEILFSPFHFYNECNTARSIFLFVSHPLFFPLFVLSLFLAHLTVFSIAEEDAVTHCRMVTRETRKGEKIVREIGKIFAELRARLVLFQRRAFGLFGGIQVMSLFDSVSRFISHQVHCALLYFLLYQIRPTSLCLTQPSVLSLLQIKEFLLLFFYFIIIIITISIMQFRRQGKAAYFSR